MEEDKRWTLEKPAASRPITRKRSSLYADVIRDFLAAPADDMPEAAVVLKQEGVPLEEQKTSKAIFSGLYKAAKAVTFQYEDGSPMLRVELRRGEPVLVRLSKP